LSPLSFEAWPDPGHALHSLPLVTLHLTERCNSRCVSCDYWRHGRDDMTLASVSRLLPELLALQTQTVLISGGEPLLHPEWPQIAELLRERGMSLWLVTSGLSLAKHASRAAALFDAITVSLDGTTPAMYAAIRGLNAFDKVCEGIRRTVLEGARVSIRVTLQRMNYRALPGFVDLAKSLGAAEISFLAADVANAVAFGRTGNFRDDSSTRGLSLQPADLPEFAAIVGAMERTHAADFRSGLIAESPRKLRRLHDYFAAVCGLGEFPPTHCNAPEFSAVIGATGRVSPCFFINGPSSTTSAHGLQDDLNAAAMIDLRSDIRAGRRPECATCVCSLWRDPHELSGFRLERASHAAV
jgi:MoaA/NifB/PqqE/SkfB family radical SAM enzyme